jgi:hypothetical protein
MMDDTQIQACLDYMIGERMLGGAVAGDEITTPHSPELRAFMVARLGDQMPRSGYSLVRLREHPGYRDGVNAQAKALAALLREVADAIDPPTEATAE